MEKREFIKLMESITKKVEAAEVLYDSIEIQCGDQVIGDLVSVNFFSEMVDLLSLTLNDKQELLKQFFAAGAKVPSTYEGAAQEYYSDLYDLITK